MPAAVLEGLRLCNIFQLALQSAARLTRGIVPCESYSLELLVLLIVAGCVVQIADRHDRLEAWIAPIPEPSGSGRKHIVVPPSVLGGLALLGLVIFSGVGCFAYYVPLAKCLKKSALPKVER